MDPRNPLGRLDRLSRQPNVARLSLSFESTGADLKRSIEVVTIDGRRKQFRLGPRSSYVDLLDRVAAFLDR